MLQSSMTLGGLSSNVGRRVPAPWPAEVPTEQRPVAAPPSDKGKDRATKYARGVGLIALEPYEPLIGCRTQIWVFLRHWLHRLGLSLFNLDPSALRERTVYSAYQSATVLRLQGWRDQEVLVIARDAASMISSR